MSGPPATATVPADAPATDLGHEQGRARPVQERSATVVRAEAEGAYVRLVLAAPRVAAGARPGQFVALGVGEEGSAMLLRRSFSIADADPAAGTVDVVVADAGPGSRWLTRRRAGDVVDVAGPLGAAFPLLPGPAVLVGGGYGVAPLGYLRRALPDPGAATVVSGAASADRLLAVDDAVVTTDDGSAGRRGRVTDALADLLADGPVAAVYACGPMPMLAAVEQVATAAGVPSYLAVEEAMACGIGVCMTCVLPVSRPAGASVRMLRSCVEGPVFAAGEVQFAAVGTVPAGRAIVSRPDLSTTLAGVALPTPVLTASGCAAAGRELDAFVDVSALGAVVTKSVMRLPRTGRPTPRMAETPSGMLNSIGLQGPGIDAFLEHDLPWLAERGARAVVSIAGSSVEEYAELADKVAAAPGVSLLEVNISCPNVEDRGKVFACSAPAASAVVREVAARVDVPVLAKLSPDVTDIVAIAAAVVEAGADGLSLINTLLGLVLDPDTLRPVLGGITGGLSGPAVRPVALRCVWQVAAALPDVPVLGMGGIRTGADALQFLAAGASAVSVGTAVFGDPGALARITDELAAELERLGHASVAEVIGVAHRPPGTGTTHPAPPPSPPHRSSGAGHQQEVR